VAARHRSRQRALQVLYQWDLTKQPVENAISSFYDTMYSGEEEDERTPERDAFMEELATGTSQMAPVRKRFASPLRIISSHLTPPSRGVCEPDP